MTQPTITAAPTSHTSCAILASDFSRSTSDQLRRQWTGGKMRHLIDALNGAPVVIIIDEQTGFAMVNVRLRLSMLPNEFVTVESTLPDGTVHQVDYRLWKLGETIIPLTGALDNVKWNALRAYNDEQDAAIRLASAAHGAPEGRSWGNWAATPTGGKATRVTYTPITTNEHYRDKWGTYWFGRVKGGVVYPSC